MASASGIHGAGISLKNTGAVQKMKKNRVLSAVITAGFLILCTGEAMNAGRFSLEAHRGISERYPENTLVSFEAAGKIGAYRGIETDVQETADGGLVLFHDATLDKKTDAEGEIGAYTLDEVRKIRIDQASNTEQYPDLGIPTLEEYLAVCRQYGKIPYIELKSLSEAGMEKLLAILQDGGWMDRCVITTFVKEYIPQFRKLNQTIPVEYMIDRKEDYQIDDVITFLSGYPNMLFRPNAYQVTEEEVDACRRNGIGVEAFGLKTGDREAYAHLKKIGVRGVTCNDYTGLW